MERDYSALVKEAYETARKYHEGQFDKAGRPYFNHPLAVSGFVSSDKEKIVALLHDTVEDTEFTLEMAREKFGDEIAEALDCVTHREGEAYMDYVKRAAGNPIAKAVKLADLRHNMDLSRIENPTENDFLRLEKKYKPALEYLMNIF